MQIDSLDGLLLTKNFNKKSRCPLMQRTLWMMYVYICSDHRWSFIFYFASWTSDLTLFFELFWHSYILDNTVLRSSFLSFSSVVDSSSDNYNGQSSIYFFLLRQSHLRVLPNYSCKFDRTHRRRNKSPSLCLSAVAATTFTPITFEHTTIDSFVAIYVLFYLKLSRFFAMQTEI